MNKEHMNKMIIINDSNWVRLSAAYKKIIAKEYWRFIFDLLSLVENSTFMEIRADPPESSAIWKVLNVYPLCSNLRVLRPFREVPGRFFFSDGK